MVEAERFKFCRADFGQEGRKPMNLEFTGLIVQWFGGLLALVALGLVLYGIWRGTQRQTGRTTGLGGSWLRSPWLYFASAVFFFGIAYLGWVPLPLTFTTSTRIVMLVLGSLFYFPGMSLLVWGRLALGKNYFVSTGLGARLYSDHQLVKTGPYAYMRHPMYCGLVVSAVGSLLIYSTWTTVFFVCFAPLMFVRAWREEKALSAEFGDDWQEYCRCVPAFFPRFGKG
jgi:protein-S-isoprenylcysteine O-methyltransferase Ste14